MAEGATPSAREVVGAVLELTARLGLEQTRETVRSLTEPALGARLEPAALALLETLDGRLDGRTRYPVTGAAARFVRTCDPDNLLGAVERLLRLERPDGPWLRALVAELRELLGLAEVQALLSRFELDEQVGRPAVVDLMGRVMLVLARDAAPVEGVRTLLESALHPVISAELQRRIAEVLRLLEEATDSRAAVLGPLQAAMRCGNRQAQARDVLLGFVYDLATVPELGVEGWVDGVGALEALSSPALARLADGIRALRSEPSSRDVLLEALATLLEPSSAERWVPVGVELIERGVVREGVEAVVRLLDDCEAEG